MYAAEAWTKTIKVTLVRFVHLCLHFCSPVCPRWDTGPEGCNPGVPLGHTCTAQTDWCSFSLLISYN